MARALRTTTFNEPKNLSDVLKFEVAGTMSREVVTILSGAGVLEIGTVLAIRNDGGNAGKYVAAIHDTEATNGSNVAEAVLAQRVDATSSDVTHVIVIERLAEVSIQDLVWHASVDNATKRGLKLADLKKKHIIGRNHQ